MLRDVEALPATVRPARHETLSSYSERLRIANGFEPRRWRLWTNALFVQAQAAHNMGPETVIETLAGLAPGHFKRETDRLFRHADGGSCEQCQTGLQERYACRRCVNGDTVPQHAHDGPRVCRRHRLWVGPGTTSYAQFPVGPDVIAADRTYRKLRKAGRADAHRLAEVLGCVDAWNEAERGGRLDAAARFTIAVSILSKVLTPAAVTNWLNPGAPARERREQLEQQLTRIVGDAAVVALTDAVWMLLRHVLLGDADGTHPFGHARLASVATTDDMNEVLKSSNYPRGRHLHLTQFVGSERGGTRYDHAGRSTHKNRYRCVRGHAFAGSTANLSVAKAGGGCGYCARKRVLPGFNSLADTHPSIAAEWDSEANSISPTSVTSGSNHKAAWRCVLGHCYSQAISRRTTRGSGCTICSNQRVAVGVNALSDTHPHVAAQWHPVRNGTLTPSDVVAGSDRYVWWRCSAQHEHRSKIHSRVSAGCLVCRGRIHRAGSNLAEAYPEVAAQWHGARNGALTPEDVRARSRRVVWWICARGHEFEAQVASRVRFSGCRFCSSRDTTADNVLRHTHPHLAVEFDDTKNGGLTPDSVRASYRGKVWWRCLKHGHEWESAVVNRATKGHGCPYCANRKVLAGFNDLASTHPALSEQWATDLNHDRSPWEVVAGTAKESWWRCGHCGHAWVSSCRKRVASGACPSCKRPPR